MKKDDTSHRVQRYIQAAFKRQPYPVLELWRSQSHVMANINDDQSYCVRMPTGSGKTRIAELAILKFLIATEQTPEKKCIYIAPYRALAVEVEQSLRRSFREVKVSQLYDSSDMSPAELLLAEIDEARILIATPEKMDASFRYNDELLKQVGLIIVDEGHIIDNGERGLRYELFLHRLVRCCKRNNARMLFISAVMPNVEEFSRWIAGKDSKDGVLISNFHPTRQQLGILCWDREAESGRLDTLYQDRDRRGEIISVPNYITAVSPTLLKDAGYSERKYPGKSPTKQRLAALAAIRAAQSEPTMIFTPQADLVTGIALELIEVIELKERTQGLFEIQAILPVNDVNKLEQCKRFALESAGPDSPVYKALEKRFVMHNGEISRALRVRLEELIREGIIQLVVSNTTLAQGVNLPIRTIFIHSLYNHGIKLLAGDFWNLCGRAGRAFKETKGDVYLIAESVDDYQKTENHIIGYINDEQSKEILSPLRLLLKKIVEAWNPEFPQFDTDTIAQLCTRLTDDDTCWLSNDANDWLQGLRADLRILDSQLLALVEEEQQFIEELNQVLTSAENQPSAIVDPSVDLTKKITDLFKDSMFYLQVSSQRSEILPSDAISLLVQRIKHIVRVCPTSQKRRRFYKPKFCPK